MTRSCRSRYVELRARLALVVVFPILVAVALAAQAPPAAVASDEQALVDQADKAEAALRFDLAASRLYQLLLEHPRAADSWTRRLRLARLLALSGALPSAILQCQRAREEGPGDPERRIAGNLATTLARRIRAQNGAVFFPNISSQTARAITSLDEPTAVAYDSSGTFLLVDSGSGRTYRVDGDAATAAGGNEEISAATFLPDGSIVSAGKNGISVGGAKPVMLTGAFDGRTRQLKRVRAMASTSNGDLLLVDKDYDGLLRCKAGTTTCAPWGTPGKLRTVKVGTSDFVYLLDDKQQSVRVLDRNGRQIAAAGPMLGTSRLGEVVDLAVDSAYGLYLLDKEAKRVHIAVLRSGLQGPLNIAALGSTVLPAEGDRAVKNPSAIGVSPDGTMIVAGRSHSLRFQ